MDLAKTLAGSAVAVALLVASGCGSGNGGGGGGGQDASLFADGGGCPPGLTLCVDDTPSCEDLMSSGGNCGFCNNKCPSGTSCEGGVCR
jgi:hypothetical protein